LANLLQSSRSTFSWGSFPSFFAFQEGMLDTHISALGGWPTVSGGFVRQGGRAKKPLPKWLIRFVTGAPRGTTPATVESKTDCTYITAGASGVAAQRLTSSASTKRCGEPSPLSLQFLLELVEEAPVSPLGNKLLRTAFDHPELMQAQGIEAHGVLGVVLAPPCPSESFG
jgi:hypothetical protein